MRTASSGSATVAPRVPTFTSRELYERIDDVLGRDITGTVYSLKDFPDLAVKVIPLSNLDKDSADATRLELTAFLDLSHPGVLKYYQVIEYKGLIYVVMDRYDKTLERLIVKHKRKKSPVSVAVILSTLRQLAAALAYLHDVSGAGARWPVRCDLKPANVLVGGDGEHFVIADSGLCRDALWNESTFASTAAYRAPEVLLRNEASPASEMWSLGVILYELATLRRPDFLEGKKPAEVFVDGWRPDLSSVTDGFIKGILDRIFVLEPKRRLTAGELHEILTAVDIPVDELRAQYITLRYTCSSLKTALNSACDKIAVLKDELRVKLDRITALEAALGNRPSGAKFVGQEPRIKATGIDAFEGRMTTLENRLAQVSSGTNTIGTQTDFSLLKLIYAAHTNDIGTVWTLVNDGFSIGQRDEQGMTALMHAAQQGHTGPVELLVEKERGLQDKNGWTALMHAVHNNHPEVVEILAPYERRIRNKDSRTALMIAAEEGHAEAASVLVSYEEDLIDSEGKTALMIAMETGHQITVNVLESTDMFGETRLMRAAMHGCIDTAKLVMKYDSGAQDMFGVTALMNAASAGQLEIAKLLVDREGGMTDTSGTTALMNAASTGNVEIVKLLIDLEGGIKDKEEMTALDYGALNGHLEVVQALLDKEKHLIDKSDECFFAMINARGYSEIARLLKSDTPSTDDCSDRQAVP
ncbi:Kinase, NEK [Giardia lamblia P15]|uniref:Kinase, NEK n=1 Tax=Giardia intestinalis (strain P15) TaxID=658858 RepID=E1F0Y6_GIAIA|nr:Kinase, NEK [Giardia lamblia P15]